MEVKVRAKFLRTTPRKLRLLADLVRGKNMAEASNLLRFSPKEASNYVLNLLNSAVDIAKNREMNEESLYIKSISCDEGPKLKRRRINSHGSASSIIKRMSHLSLVLDEKEVKETKKPKVKKEVKQEKVQEKGK